MVPAESPTFFKVNDLSIRFGSLEALRGVEFEVKQGRVLGIAGPNGAGKTTLLNIIAGVLKPTSGKVSLGGEILSGLKPMEVCRRGIGRIFQIPVVFPTLTVRDNIRVGLSFGHAPGKEPSKGLSEIVDFMGLNGKEDLLAANIDLYSRKLVMLGAALATDPKVLLLDEPLGGLNFQEIDDYLKVIRQVNREMGVTLLVVEHLFDKLVEVSDEIMILNFGERIYLGSSQAVGDDPTVIQVYLGMKHHA